LKGKTMIDKVPVILDTDIGSDIDDAWALAMMLRSPELDVKLVTSCTSDTTARARIIAKMLALAGRDVPVGIGVPMVHQEMPYA
jgi:inosine-uridine nucleoside N-ribohydrolase